MSLFRVFVDGQLFYHQIGKAGFAHPCVGVVEVTAFIQRPALKHDPVILFTDNGGRHGPSMDHAERATTLIPLGAKIKTIDEMGNEVETDERVGIAAVNDGKNYIFDDAAVKEIGWGDSVVGGVEVVGGFADTQIPPINTVGRRETVYILSGVDIANISPRHPPFGLGCDTGGF